MHLFVNVSILILFLTSPVFPFWIFLIRWTEKRPGKPLRTFFPVCSCSCFQFLECSKHWKLSIMRLSYNQSSLRGTENINWENVPAPKQVQTFRQFNWILVLFYRLKNNLFSFFATLESQVLINIWIGFW